ncbi:hypothetical protein [Actinoplanes sp. CA-252034]|uniref:hypothetical protein n=1 Tax=Actinoplanes sp. CA-252034 TaxID=3239906 RepID=UPI003D999341
MAWWKRKNDDDRPPIGDWRDDPRVTRVAELTENALELQRLGHIDQALSGSQEAVELGRELSRVYPEPVHLQELAGRLYGLAGILNRVGRADEAVDALEESLVAYQRVAATGAEDVAPLIADVRARQATSLAHLGRATTAVVRADLAMDAYRELAAGPERAVRLPDLVRVLGVNAQVLAYCGDPDLACAAADEAIATFTDNLELFDRLPQAAAYFQMLTSSCALAGRIHAVHGRMSSALAADAVGVRLADVLVEYGGDGHRALQAAAVARQGTHLLADGQPATGAARLRQAWAIDATATATQVAQVDDVEGEAGQFGVTLGSSLRRAAELSVEGVDGVLDLVTGHPGPSATTPSTRCAPDRVAERAEALGRVGLATLRVAPAEGIRIGIEAHLMLAALWERGGRTPVFWAELLHTLRAELGRDLADQYLGEDIEQWHERSRRQAA